MTMYSEVTETDFRRAFHAKDKENQFSYGGLGVLFEHLTDVAKDYNSYIMPQDGSLHKPFILDVKAVCSEYQEYADFTEVTEDYDRCTSLEAIAEWTTVLRIEGTDRVIIATR